MNTIWDAIQAAQARNKEEDRLRALRQQEEQPVLPGFYGRNNFATPVNGNLDNGSGGEGTPPSGVTLSPAEQYAQAISVNKSPVVQAPVVGTIIGLMNNRTIQDYEKKNPNEVVDDPNKIYTPLVQQMIQAIMGGRSTSPYDNINAFPNRQNFNEGNDPNSDISGSVDTTDQSPGVGIGDQDETAVA